MRFVFFLLLFVPETSVKNVETQRDGPAETACILNNHLDVLNGAAMEGLPRRESGFRSMGLFQKTTTRRLVTRPEQENQRAGSRRKNKPQVPREAAVVGLLG